MYFKPIEELDEIDNTILAMLSDNARATYSEIGERTGISRVAIRNRITALEKKGYIGGYKALINRTADSKSIRFFMDLEVEPAKYGNVLDTLALFKSCRQIYSCTSSNRIHVTGYTPDYETLDNFVAMLYRNLDGVNRITFQVVTAIHKDSDGGIEYVRRSENKYLERPADEAESE